MANGANSCFDIVKRLTMKAPDKALHCDILFMLVMSLLNGSLYDY